MFIETEYRNTEKQRERETKISVLFSTVIMIDRSSRSQPGSRSDLLPMYDGRQHIKK